MSDLCPHCEGEMDDFGGVHLRSCPLAQGNEQGAWHNALNLLAVAAQQARAATATPKGQDHG